MRITLGISILLLLLFTGATAWADNVVFQVTLGGIFSETADLGGTFKVYDSSARSTGSGVIDPFLSMKASMQGTGEKTSEMGYNTDVSPTWFDESRDTGAKAYTRSLLLTEVPIVNIGGTDYREFLLDINQSGSAAQQLLSLNQIQIFQAAADPTFSAAPSTGIGAIPVIAGLGTEIFRMSGSSNTSGNSVEIVMDYSLHTGSGQADIFLYVPNSLFNNTLLPNVVLFSQFGNPPGTNATNDGYEEWAVLKGGTSTSVPDGGTTALLLGLALAAGGLISRRMK